ncbi:MAG TPA: PA domain-containing protein [Pyrinomonadaceae bacterium]|nr:PA domain-containing protein [Pyrinomonadaceae bacterium]
MSSIGKFIFRKFSAVLLTLTASAMLSSSAFGAATIVILNGDAAGVGFNDPTSVTPVGGNPGTTLGQQRLNAFQHAANIWGATLVSSSTITVRATWEPLSCTANSAVLGSAGAANIFRNFVGAPFSDTWYGSALANALTGVDLNANHEINARFNINLGNSDCLSGSPFYLGLDANHGAGVDLVSVLLHEFSHGLGFQTFTNSSSGVQNGGFPSIYDRFLFDNTTGKIWINMTDAERQASAINTGNLAWTGANVTNYARSILATPRLRVNAPAAIAGNYQVGTASFGAPISFPGSTANVVQSVPADGCTALTNGPDVTGKIALIDRGTCNFTVKVKNAQDAGAVAVVIVDNVQDSPPPALGGSDPAVTIPSVRITLNDGNTIKAQLGAGVNASLFLDRSTPGGADATGRALLFTPNPFQGGSSVSHFDSSAYPNQLMEPNISGDLRHYVTPPYELTTPLFRDLGWTTVNPIDLTEFFVHQHYIDFFNREPDAGGLAFWINEITSCGANAACVDLKRTNVSAAFYVSIEFQETGYLVYRMYKAGYGNLDNGAAPVPVRFAELLPDTQQIGNGVVVGVGNWQTRLNNNKVVFAQDFVSRASFIARHPISLTPAEFVDALFTNGGVTPAAGDRTAAINEFGGAGNTANTAARARALRLVAENATLSSQESNKAFVLMQYFGYLRRNPYDPPEPTLDYTGYNFWLNKLNQFNGNYVTAEMVRSFLVSNEYRQRFGP